MMGAHACWPRVAGRSPAPRSPRNSDRRLRQRNPSAAPSLTVSILPRSATRRPSPWSFWLAPYLRKRAMGSARFWPQLTNKAILRIEQITDRPSRPLLAIDGDSFAHRAYHGLPKSIRRRGNRAGGAIVGFANFLLRLYESERPRAVLVGWDTLDVPTYRHRAFAAYQSGCQFDAELRDRLGDALPRRSFPTSSPACRRRQCR